MEGVFFSYGVCPSDSDAVLGPGRALTLSQKRGWGQPRVGGSAPGSFLYRYRLTSSPVLIASIIARSPATFLALSVMRSPLWLSPDLPCRLVFSGATPDHLIPPGRRRRRRAGPGGRSGRRSCRPGAGSRTCGAAGCRRRRWRPGSGGSHRSAYRRFNQCGGGAASRSRGWAARGCQRGMVDKAAGCAEQGILILAWLETRDHFNPFALRASEDFPVDVDRPT